MRASLRPQGAFTPTNLSLRYAIAYYLLRVRDTALPRAGELLYKRAAPHAVRAA